MTDTRSRRLRTLADLLRSGTLASQEEATERLRALGFAVTQATVSRDLEQLGAIKVKRGGVLTYALPDQMAETDWTAGRLERILGEWVLSIEAAGQLLIVKTPPGSAHLVASAIDHAQLPEIAGTVSGDDTLFLAVRDGVAIPTLLCRFERLMGKAKEVYA
ncbi:arginine repressor [Sphingosinicella sp. CPCC 101087]|uniref:arginine repressor n=1 Tax=Sphingosinicella sp. CPCC 101087 TaxID=2497754 RepID=UPI00101C2163|nr:arginine repressor [Sphingosinicella sp. CPCC 101087]